MNTTNKNEVTAIAPVAAFEQLTDNKDRSLTTLKSGTKVSGLLTKRAYAEAHSLKGSALINRKYDEYVRQAGASNRATAAAIMANENVIVRKFKLSDDGSKFSIEGTVQEKPQVDLSLATEDDAGSMIDRLRELIPGVKVELPKPAATVNV